MYAPAIAQIRPRANKIPTPAPMNAGTATTNIAPNIALSPPGDMDRDHLVHANAAAKSATAASRRRRLNVIAVSLASR